MNCYVILIIFLFLFLIIICLKKNEIVYDEFNNIDDILLIPSKQTKSSDFNLSQEILKNKYIRSNNNNNNKFIIIIPGLNNPCGSILNTLKEYLNSINSKFNVLNYNKSFDLNILKQQFDTLYSNYSKNYEIIIVSYHFGCTLANLLFDNIYDKIIGHLLICPILTGRFNNLDCNNIILPYQIMSSPIPEFYPNKKIKYNNIEYNLEDTYKYFKNFNVKFETYNLYRSLIYKSLENLKNSNINKFIISEDFNKITNLKLAKNTNCKLFIINDNQYNIPKKYNTIKIFNKLLFT